MIDHARDAYIAMALDAAVDYDVATYVAARDDAEAAAVAVDVAFAAYNAARVAADRAFDAADAARDAARDAYKAAAVAKVLS